MFRIHRIKTPSYPGYPLILGIQLLTKKEFRKAKK
jgi:hypothetical protein